MPVYESKIYYSGDWQNPYDSRAVDIMYVECAYCLNTIVITARDYKRKRGSKRFFCTNNKCGSSYKSWILEDRYSRNEGPVKLNPTSSSTLECFKSKREEPKTTLPQKKRYARCQIYFAFCTVCSKLLLKRGNPPEDVDSRRYFCTTKDGGNHSECLRVWKREEYNRRKEQGKHCATASRSNPWNKGLTKETDQRVANQGLSSSPSLRARWAANRELNIVPGMVTMYDYFSPVAGQVKCQGSYELRFAQVLDKEHCEWKRSSTRFPYCLPDGFHVYIPDFEIGNVYLDTKNDYLIASEVTRSKIQAAREYNNVEILLVTLDMIENAEKHGLSIDSIRRGQPY